MLPLPLPGVRGTGPSDKKANTSSHTIASTYGGKSNGIDSSINIGRLYDTNPQPIAKPGNRPNKHARVAVASATANVRKSNVPVFGWKSCASPEQSADNKSESKGLMMRIASSHKMHSRPIFPRLLN